MSKNIYLILIVTCSFIFSAQAQDKKPGKKVIIIEKTEINGKVTETRKEAEGAEADELLKSIDPDHIEKINVEKGDKDVQVIKISKTTKKDFNRSDIDDKEMEISLKEIDGKKEKYKVITIDGDKEKVIEWDGTGEMPAEIAREMKNISINKEIDGENMTITIDDEDGDEGKEIVIMNDHPKGKRQKMMWKENSDQGNFPERIRRKMNFASDMPNKNKATLGIMIDDTDQGVIISDIVDGSAASKCGLRRGDTILKVNDTYIFTSNGLLDALKPFNANEKIKVRYIRDGKERSTKATLQAR